MSFESGIKEIKDLLEDNAHPELKRPFYLGDPLHIPASQLPTIAVDIVSGESPQGPTGHDEQSERLVIKVLVDKRQDLGNGGNKVVATEELVKYVEELDESNGQYQGNTVLGVLRKNLTLENTVINQEMSWEYGVAEREDILTAECWITISITKIIQVPNRA